ncbi:MAG TPA: class D sortase [Thermoanaerobaculia bacterium]|jgi:sortase A|nr:class D sortase [Thermoanaerobaculia bacterium]
MSVRWLERLLLLIGLICLGTVAYAYFDARLTARQEGRRLDEAIEHRQQQDRIAGQAPAGSRPAAETDSFSGLSAPAQPAPVKLEEGELVGRLEIPRLGLSTIVLEGVEAGTLRRGAGHIPGTVVNIGIAGHRDSFFRPLRDIGKNDIITLTTPEATYRYQVEWTRIVAPEETEVLADGGTPELTLVTCYPFSYVGSAPQRFIVRAQRIGDESGPSLPSP